MNALSSRLHPQRLRRTFGAASCVRERARFVSAELRDVPAVRDYRLRRSGRTVVIRHPLLDMWVLEELFRFRAYEPPVGAVSALRALLRPPRIVDAGGHIGLFGLYMLALFPEAWVTSFEPDPRNAAILGRCVAANRLQARWRIVEACAAVSDGHTSFTSSFHLSRTGRADDEALAALQQGIGSTFPFLRGSALVESEERSVPCRDIFAHLDECDLLKLDIEGGEWEIIADERFDGLAATAVVLEYHPAYTPDPDPEATVTRRLRDAGYELSEPARGKDGATLWAWKSTAAHT